MRRLLVSREMPGCKCGGQYRVNIQELDRWIDEQAIVIAGAKKSNGDNG